LVPSEWDQFDNARRAERAGLGRVMDIASYTGPNIATAIAMLENDAAVREGLMQIAPILAQEDGARVACDAVEKLLGQSALHTAIGSNPPAPEQTLKPGLKPH
jgi:UDP:flavonoid glycosyltransferase YjiC (YdhE family)